VTAVAGNPNILVIEDDLQIRRFVRAALESLGGCTVAEATTGRQGILEAAARKPALILLDLGLPDMDGLQVIREIRHWSATPVLVLSARSQEREKVAALDGGADDYLTKPFGIPEMLARVRALLRRQRPGGVGEPVHRFGDVVVDLVHHRVTRGGSEVHLTPIEFSLLSQLLAQPGKVLTQGHLLRQVWGPGYAESVHYLRVYVGHLRQKLEADPARPRHLLTETGIGYRFEA
jgi:two-component system KDP operon response regulator KdpE